VPILVKIDQETRPQTDRYTHTHTHTHTQTQTDFIICPMLYAIAMGQITSNRSEIKSYSRQLSQGQKCQKYYSWKGL